MHNIGMQLAIVALFIAPLCAPAAVDVVAGQWRPGECIALTATVQDPSNAYYSGVTITGQNNCNEPLDLSTAQLVNYAPCINTTAHRHTRRIIP